MKKCSYCGADLPNISRFCGNCGRVQDAIDETNAATIRGKTPQPQSSTPESGTIQTTWPLVSNDLARGGVPAWSPNIQPLGTPPPSVDENEDEDRRGVPAWPPLYGAAMGGDALLRSGQVYTSNTPFVQGTPQIGNVPSVAGSPIPYANLPASQSIPGAGNMPVSYPMQGALNAAPSSPFPQVAGNMPVSYPVQGSGNMPVGHPVQGSGNVPVGYPVQSPQPIPRPPEQPGTQGPHKSHHRRTHSLKHEPDHDDLHPVKHAIRREGATKVAGGSTVKTIILVVTAVVVVAAGGVAAAAHFLSHPQPSISITSNYKVGNIPAGANGTVLYISGQQFSSNSAITFLLDGHVAPGIPGTQSDSNGNFSTNMSIPNVWDAGPHTLSARDASNYSPQNAVSVTIVQQGQANTPGPNGAPPDDASFKIKVTIASRYRNVADPFGENPVLIITGHPDPKGGSICSPDDNGQPFSFNETDTIGTPGIQFNKTLTAACSGTYKAGQISFIETSTSVKQYWQYSNGINVTCVLNNPTVDLRLTGSYAGNNTFSGTLNSPYFTYTCDHGYGNSYHEAANGVHWTGTVVKQ